MLPLWPLLSGGHIERLRLFTITVAWHVASSMDDLFNHIYFSNQVMIGPYAIPYHVNEEEPVPMEEKCW